jgi:hypothetical protein
MQLNKCLEEKEKEKGVYGADHSPGQLGKTVPHSHMIREGDPKGWSTMLITVLGSWEKNVP